jgi:hypothetical protein
MTVQNVGEVRLVHATSPSAAREIEMTGKMMPGLNGRLGAGIYWAENEEFARRKSLHDGRGQGAVVFATVIMDNALVLQGQPNKSVANLLPAHGAVSVMWLPAAGMSSPGWEYVVYDSWRVKVDRVVIDPPAGDLGAAALREGVQVELVGKYSGDSYGGGGTHSRAIGSGGLSIGRVFRVGRQLPFEILRDGVAISWAPAHSIQVK